METVWAHWMQPLVEDFEQAPGKALVLLAAVALDDDLNAFDKLLGVLFSVAIVSLNSLPGPVRRS